MFFGTEIQVRVLSSGMFDTNDYNADSFQKIKERKLLVQNRKINFSVKKGRSTSSHYQVNSPLVVALQQFLVNPQISSYSDLKMLWDKAVCFINSHRFRFKSWLPGCFSMIKDTLIKI